MSGVRQFPRLTLPSWEGAKSSSSAQARDMAVFKIGDFSRITRVSTKMLRHYDEIGLFKPALVDRFTGYRYYSYDQLPRLNRILVLKGLGFSLDDIRQMLDG